MCRLMYIRSKTEFEIPVYLKQFADASSSSKEYQGHGWGCSYLIDNQWHHYKNISPVWEDDLDQFGKTNLLLVHARSAFQNKDIIVENNMPFYDDKNIFIFNGELRGVKIKAEGRIGAEKIFNFVKRFDKGNTLTAVEKGSGIIKRRSAYIRGMNFIIADKEKAYVNSFFSEDDEYFTLHKFTDSNMLILCSEILNGYGNWENIPNNFIGEF